MKRKVRWHRPKTDRLGRVTRTSHSGRYVILTRSMASLTGRNGHFTLQAYELQCDGRRLGKLHDQLNYALDAAEVDHDPSWDAEN